MFLGNTRRRHPCSSADLSFAVPQERGRKPLPSSAQESSSGKRLGGQERASMLGIESFAFVETSADRQIADCKVRRRKNRGFRLRARLPTPLLKELRRTSRRTGKPLASRFPRDFVTRSVTQHSDRHAGLPLQNSLRSLRLWGENRELF